MKNLFLLCFILFLFSLSASAQDLNVIRYNGQNFVSKEFDGNLYLIAPSSGSGFLNLNSPPVNNLNKSYLYNWELKLTAPGKVLKAVSFATPQVGYIAAELGVVYKTTDGGENWTAVMNTGFPYYWYGVDALSPDTVVISGFNNQGDINSGVLRWSFDGGATWSSDIILHLPFVGVGWLSHIHFFNSDMGIVSNEFSGGIYYTLTGGKDSTDWNYLLVNADKGWFAGNIDVNSNGHIYTTGIHFAHSSDYGVTWTSGPSADNVFDGGVDFLDDNLVGMTGGGQISAPVSGWMHRTTDGGSSWSPRLFNFPFPIRSVKLLDASNALAFGGNLYGNIGGIYITTDAGSTWTQDLTTDAELFSYEFIPISSDSADIWAVGSTGGSFNGKAYKTRIAYVTIPVELTSFTAKHLNGNVELHWVTSTEMNNRGFEIERGSNGNYITVGFVNGKGTSTEVQNYYFSDNNVQPGVYNYRLKQIDFNGRYEFFLSNEVIVNSPFTFELAQNYPNPFNPSTMIKYSIVKDGLVKLKLYNTLGEETAVLKDEYQEAGTYSLEFTAAGLSSGVYYLRLESNNFTDTKKMILTK